MTGLPTPARERWQPLRIGLVNLYYYDDEVFAFHGGRLLLRGNNGTGKSKVLALTLPLLLDAQLMPARVEPDGDSAKRIEWNLLMNGDHGERTGYAWLELGRVDGDGIQWFCTIGIGLRAVAGRPGVDRWFFVTSLRPGDELRLVEREFPLGRDRLATALGDSGQVFTTAERYRRAVDEALFGLGEDRYRALVDLLVQLRQPQLSKRPDEATLSRALTEALPPLDRSVLTDVAEALTDLDTERAELEGLRESAAAVDTFRDHYTRYAAIATRRVARTLRTAQSQYEATGQSLRTAREGHEAAEACELELLQRLERAREARADARARQEALRARPEMRDANALEEKRRHAEDIEEHAREVEQAQADREREAAEQQAERERRAGTVKETRSAVHALESRLDAAATQAGITSELDRLRRDLALPDGPAAADPEGVVARASQGVERRRQGVRHVESLDRELTATNERTRAAHAHHVRLSEESDAAEQRRADAEQAVDDARERHLAAWREALAAASELALAEPEAGLDATAAWARTLDGPDPLRQAAEAARDAAAHAFGQERGRLEAAHAGLEDQRATLAAEYKRLSAGEDTYPPRPHWRDPETRADRPGAPLWRLIDFREDLDQNARAGLEAALEAAGLLDAWVTPGGLVEAPMTGDVLLQAVAGTDTDGGGLGHWLVPAVDRDDGAAGGVADATVAAVIAAIAPLAHEDASGEAVGVDTSGRFRLGAARGRWRKETADYIGRGAREAARRRRLAELTEALADVDTRLEHNAAAQAALDERRRTLLAECDALPDAAELRDAHETLGRCLAELERLAGALAAAQREWEQAAAAEAEARETRDRAAEDLQLPVEAAALAAVGDALAEAGHALAGLAPTLARHFTALEDLGNVEARAEHAASRSTEAAERAVAQRARARAARVEYDTLKASVGERVEALRADLERASEAEGEAEAKRDAAEAERRENEAERARLATLIEEREHQLADDDERRREAARALQALHDDGLLPAAGAGVEPPERADEWPVDPAVRFARRVEQALQAVADDDAAWERSRNHLHERITELQQALSRHGHDAHAEQRASGLVVRVVFQGRAHTPDGLASALSEEEAERARILDERERAILENHLIDEVARSLQELIRDAEEQVAAINRELEERPTSTGMRLRIRWQPLAEGDAEEIPAGLAEARQRLLRQTAEAWSSDDRAAVGRFLKRQVDRVREGSEGGSLLEQLEHALDYRRWHRFRVERWQDGQWRSARGPASGGERVLTVMLPLFAAASGHYRSARELAPRLIALDEAFAGVDDAARAQCMGLLAQFDLDFTMTSEREWGCYATLPGLSIAHLSRFEGIEAVHVSRWRWDGQRRERVPEEAAGGGVEAPVT